MNTTTETRVPSPETEAVHEQIARNLPPEVADAHKRQRELQEANPGVPSSFLIDHPFGDVVAAVAAVMAELQPVGKGGTNIFHNYKYARMQDILQMLTPLMGKHGLAVFQYEGDRNMFDDGKVIAITYRFIVAHKSGQTWINPVPQTGMSPCRTSKGTFDDKAMAKCHTSARKYFLLSLFQIPTEDEADPDNQQAARKSGPVPSPDGHVVPHAIEPTSRDTFDTWADRYLAAARTAKTPAELDGWDAANDLPLSQMDADPKGKPVYERVLREFDVIRDKLQPKPGTVQEKAPDVHKDPPPVHAEATPVHQEQPAFVRPEGMPDAEKDPDAFVLWAVQRMNNITGAEELSLIWQEEITPGTEGLFKPDCDSLEAHYEARLAKLGG